MGVPPIPFGAMGGAPIHVIARTASGDIRVGAADASVTARAASGRVLVLGLARGRADLNPVSGDIEVKVVPGGSPSQAAASPAPRSGSYRRIDERIR